MSKDQFKALIKEMGGRDAFIDHINAALDDAGDNATVRLAQRNYYNWLARPIPASAQALILAGAVHAGISPSQAVEIMPELAPALAIARKVAA